MNTHRKFHRMAWSFVSLILMVVMAACSAENKPAASTGFVAADGFACPEPNPRVEFTSKEISIYTWTEYVPADIFECFGLVYDVEVNVDYFSSNEELYSKVSLGQEKNLYDVIHPSDYMIGVLVREKLLQKLDYDRLPNTLNLDTTLVASYGALTNFVVPYQMGTQGIIYNTKTVKTPPTSWADLWNPEYAGRIVSVDDSRVVIGATLLALGYEVNDVSPTHLDEAKGKLQELVSNIMLFDSDSPSAALLAGDADLGIVWNGEAFSVISEDSNFHYVFPEEGSIVFYDGMGILTTAQHSDAAYAWFNYLHQGDVNWLALTEYPYTNPNMAALEFAKENHPDVYNAYISSPVTNTPAREFERGQEVLDLGASLLYYELLWSEVR